MIFLGWVFRWDFIICRHNGRTSSIISTPEDANGVVGIIDITAIFVVVGQYIGIVIVIVIIVTIMVLLLQQRM